MSEWSVRCTYVGYNEIAFGATLNLIEGEGSVETLLLQNDEGNTQLVVVSKFQNFRGTDLNLPRTTCWTRAEGEFVASSCESTMALDLVVPPIQSDVRPWRKLQISSVQLDDQVRLSCGA